MIPLSVPNISGNEWQYVKQCLDSGWISSAGSFVTSFEDSIASYTGAKYAVACMNGTAGLHVALTLSDVTEGDYIIAPNLTFVATLNSASYCGAEPILIDVDPHTWQIDLSLVQEFLEEHAEVRDGNCVLKSDGRCIRAIIPVHVLGNIGDIDSVLKLADKYHISVVEDACESLGSTYNEKHSGTFGKFGVLSFNGNKIISTGGGGMILTDDQNLARRAAHLTTQAKLYSHEYDHDQIGYNYRLVNVLAAIGVAQMERIGEVLERNAQREAYYREKLAEISEFQFQTVEENVNPNCWLFTLRTRNMRALLEHLCKRDIQARPFWKPMSQLAMFKDCHYINRADSSAQIYSEAISLPSSGMITDQELEEVVDAISEFFNKPRAAKKRIENGKLEDKTNPVHWNVQLFELNYDHREADAAKKVIDSRWITMGDQTIRFESNFAELLRNRVGCTAVSSCTAALHTALLALEIGHGDEVIIPALTFVADANVVKIVGATPVPADSTSLEDWNMSVESIERNITERTKAVMIVHYAGYPCDMDPILALVKKRNLKLIEDVAHAPGATYKGQPCGTFGDFGCFSFFTNKNLSIGEGGMLTASSRELQQKAGFFRSQGMTSQTLDRHKGHHSGYDVVVSGLNYRMDEIRAAIGLIQLEKLPAGNKRRKEIVSEYHKAMRDLSTVTVPFLHTENCEPAYHIYPVLLPSGAKRELIVDHLRNKGIQTSIHYLSFRGFSVFQEERFPETPIADEVSARVLTLPLFPTMTNEQVTLVVDGLREALQLYPS